MSDAKVIDEDHVDHNAIPAVDRQYSNKDWHRHTGGSAHAESAMDRIVRNTVVIETDTPSTTLEDVANTVLGKAILEFYMTAPRWFTVVFDADKIARLGLSVVDLLDKVNDIVLRYGIKRIEDNAWIAPDGDRGMGYLAYEKAMTELSRRRWFMESVSEWIAYDEETPWGEDMLEIARELPLELVE